MSQRFIQIRPLVETDLEDIYSYSYREFGSNRASQYIHDLDTAFQRLAQNPNLGTKCDFIKSGLYSYQVVSHIIFFRFTKSSIAIIRVLHKAMDYQRHLLSMWEGESLERPKQGEFEKRSDFD